MGLGLSRTLAVFSKIPKPKSKSRSKGGASKARSRSKSSSPRLPQELCDYVIDYLHCNRAALKACSLVCKDWLPASRLHLSRAIYRWPSKCADLLSLLESPLCTIKPFVKTLEIEFPRPATRSLLVDQLVPCLGHLHSIEIVELILHQRPQLDLWDLSEFLPNLKHLKVIEYWNVPHVRTFTRLGNYYYNV
jgi:hypothetical protein